MEEEEKGAEWIKDKSYCARFDVALNGKWGWFVLTVRMPGRIGAALFHKSITLRNKTWRNSFQKCDNRARLCFLSAVPPFGAGHHGFARRLLCLPQFSMQLQVLKRDFVRTKRWQIILALSEGQNCQLSNCEKRFSEVTRANKGRKIHFGGSVTSVAFEALFSGDTSHCGSHVSKCDTWWFEAMSFSPAFPYWLPLLCLWIQLILGTLLKFESWKFLQRWLTVLWRVLCLSLAGVSVDCREHRL